MINTAAALAVVNSGMGISRPDLKLEDRSAMEVFLDHLQLRKDGKFEEDLERNYSPDVTLVSNYGTFHGFVGMHESAEILATNFPSLNYKFNSLLVNQSGAAFEEWTAESDNCVVTDGIDAFIICSGKIQIQTVWYTARDKVTGEIVSRDLQRG